MYSFVILKLAYNEIKLNFPAISVYYTVAIADYFLFFLPRCWEFSWDILFDSFLLSCAAKCEPKEKKKKKKSQPIRLGY